MSVTHQVASNPHHSTSAHPAHPSSTARSVRTEIAASIALLRFAAHVRTRNRVEAYLLVEATLQTAVASIDEYSAKISVRAWLLDIQRAVFSAGQVGGGGTTDLPSKEAGDGSEESDGNLHAALLRLPDHLREPLILRDGAQCTMAEIAEILACEPGTAERRVEEARWRFQELRKTKSEFGHSEPRSPEVE
jgi:DNA-directed RNA polymerase specialized sigma24 family protein